MVELKNDNEIRCFHKCNYHNLWRIMFRIWTWFYNVLAWKNLEWIYESLNMYVNVLFECYYLVYKYGFYMILSVCKFEKLGMNIKEHISKVPKNI